MYSVLYTVYFIKLSRDRGFYNWRLGKPEILDKCPLLKPPESSKMTTKNLAKTIRDLFSLGR